jgi:hypothetical protein
VAVHALKKPLIYKGFINLNTDGHGFFLPLISRSRQGQRAALSGHCSAMTLPWKYPVRKHGGRAQAPHSKSLCAGAGRISSGPLLRTLFSARLTGHQPGRTG